MNRHLGAQSMAEFGDELKSERERRGITLEALCAQTKVNLSHLDALEHCDYDKLPRGVFRRGIVRAYLGSVGLDERVWMPRFEASYAEHAQSADAEREGDGWETFAANVKKNRTTPLRRNTAKWLGVLALFLLMLAAAWAVWHFVLRNRIAATGSPVQGVLLLADREIRVAR